jgi:ribosomal protein S18 acetylase RimI-like enzyme
MSAVAPSLTLRPVGPADEELLLEVYASTRADELAHVPWSDEQKDAFVRRQFEAQLAHYRTYQGASFDVIERDGVPVGRLFVARWEDEIRLMDIALLPEQRGLGIGTHLIGELLGEAAESGRRLTVHVEVFNPALRLYERLGFRPVDDRGAYLFLDATPGG